MTLLAAPAATPPVGRPRSQTVAVDTPRLPPLAPWLSSVAGLWPDDPGQWPRSVCVARCRSGAEIRTAEYLSHPARRIPYCVPHERVTKWYDQGKYRRRKVWDRVLFPGFVFVGGGFEGREAARDFGSKYADTVYGFIDLSDAGQATLRRELSALSLVLSSAGDLTVHTRLFAGDRVRVTAGPFVDMEGVLARELKGGVFVLPVSTLGRSVEVEIGAELLEKLDEES